MNKILKFSIYATVALAVAFNFSACSDNDDDTDDAGKEQVLTEISKQYVNNTVITTYRSLADETITLYDAIVKLKAEKTDANVQAVANSWKKARDYWELSEAWLYGPADDFGIDPHIDTWPLDVNALESTILTNDTYIERMGKEDGDVWASDFFEDGLLGFHGIEYIVFENGKAKNVSKITDKQLIYAVAVAGDLRNQCFRLEAAWAGLDNVSSEKKAKLSAIGAELKYETTNYYYGEMLLQPGLTKFCETSEDACELILEGCVVIAEEVGTMKIGRPHTGSSEEDLNYIESPYSYNSKVDFIGNIKSIQNAYLGGIEGKRGASLSNYIKDIDHALDTEIKKGMEDAIAKIEAIPSPFAQNFTSPQAGAAMDACNDLADMLTKAKLVIRQ